MKRVVICRSVHGVTKKVLASDLLWRVCAYGVAIQDRKVLLVPYGDGYDFPGGGVERGETIHRGLVREVKEETGFDAKPSELLLVGEDFFMHPADQKPYQTVLLYYRIEILDGGKTEQLVEAYEKDWVKPPEWLPIEKAKKAKFYNPIDNTELIRRAAEVDPNA